MKLWKSQYWLCHKNEAWIKICAEQVVVRFGIEEYLGNGDYG